MGFRHIWWAAHNAPLQILNALKIINDALIGMISQGIDGKISTAQVFPQIIGKEHFLGVLKNIARERIQVELNKILISSWAGYGLETLARLNCFPYFMPEFCHTWHFAQEGSRHQFDIFTHTLKAVDLAPPMLHLRLTRSDSISEKTSKGSWASASLCARTSARFTAIKSYTPAKLSSATARRIRPWSMAR